VFWWPLGAVPVGATNSMATTILGGQTEPLQVMSLYLDEKQ